MASPDTPPDLGGLGGHVEARDRGPAPVRAQQRGEDAHRGGLAGAVGAEQPADHSLPHRQVEAVECVGLAEALAQPLGDE
ncbi:hypothetical protein GCM10020219_091210 [Nonomuraea dietziae]